jgi:hypothetical protein
MRRRAIRIFMNFRGPQALIDGGESPVLKGHDFSRAQIVDEPGVLKGHGFIRAVRRAK